MEAGEPSARKQEGSSNEPSTPELRSRQVQIELGRQSSQPSNAVGLTKLALTASLVFEFVYRRSSDGLSPISHRARTSAHQRRHRAGATLRAHEGVFRNRKEYIPCVYPYV